MKDVINCIENKKTLSIIIFLFCLLTLYGCSNSTLDDNRENISLDEAQSLASFTICFPSYLPLGIEPKPDISYYADYGDSPEKYIVLRYKRKNTTKPVFEVWQRFDPEAQELEMNLPDDVHHAWDYQLVHWIIPNDLRKADKLLKKAQIASTVFQTNHIVWWLYELTNPEENRSALTRWNKDHIRYKIYAYLSTDEIKQVTDSMIFCSNP